MIELAPEISRDSIGSWKMDSTRFGFGGGGDVCLLASSYSPRSSICSYKDALLQRHCVHVGVYVYIRSILSIAACGYLGILPRSKHLTWSAMFISD